MAEGADQDHALVVDLRAVDRPLHRVAAALGVDLLQKGLADTDAEVGEPGSIEADLTIQEDGTVLLRASVNAGFAVPCARCLAPARVAVGEELVRTYLPIAEYRRRIAGARVEEEDEEGVELAEDELDIESYDGHHVDLRRALTEHVAVAYPMRVLCARQEDCLGLCSGCGLDLNGVPEGDQACPKCGRRIDGEIGAFSADAEPSAWHKALQKLAEDDDES